MNEVTHLPIRNLSEDIRNLRVLRVSTESLECRIIAKDGKLHEMDAFPKVEIALDGEDEGLTFIITKVRA